MDIAISLPTRVGIYGTPSTRELNMTGHDMYSVGPAVNGVVVSITVYVTPSKQLSTKEARTIRGALWLTAQRWLTLLIKISVLKMLALSSALQSSTHAGVAAKLKMPDVTLKVTPEPSAATTAEITPFCPGTNAPFSHTVADRTRDP